MGKRRERTFADEFGVPSGEMPSLLGYAESVYNSSEPVKRKKSNFKKTRFLKLNSGEAPLTGHEQYNKEAGRLYDGETRWNWG